MKGLENLRDNMGLIILVIVFFLFIGIGFIWAYNFLALSDSKLFDDENKYINTSLPNPDVASNYKSTYTNKLKFDAVQLNLMRFFGSLKGIFIIAFLSLFLLGLVLKNRKMIIENFTGFFK